MHTIFVHIGTNKTGSTAIQTFLLNNSAYLTDKGFYYPPFGEKNSKYQNYRRNGDNLAYMGISQIYDTYSSICSDEQAENKDIIISSEGLWHVRNKKAYFQELMRLPYQIKVIVFLRRQYEYLSSVINQRIKSGKCTVISYPECLAQLHP